MNKVGIVGYGAYIPRHFIYSRNIDERALALGLSKKSLGWWDEDSVTMSVEAGRRAILSSQLQSTEIGAIYIGSESPAYAVNPSSTIVADILGMGHDYQAADLQFACKAATAGLQMMSAQIASDGLAYGLIIGSDKSQAKKGDALEWSAGAASVALVIGKNQILAELIGTASFSSDTPDFWRRENQPHPSHGGRFTGKPAYFRHVREATKKVMGKCALQPKDISQVVFHMPNGKFPVQIALELGFSQQQLQRTLTVSEVGNPYAASSLLGLVAALEKAKPNELILMTSYGSGAGSDSFVFRVTKNITTYRRGNLAKWFLERKEVDVREYEEIRRWQ